MVGISDFVGLRQLVAEFQTISFSEDLYLENWNIYVITFLGIVAVALMLHATVFILTRSFFKYTYSLNGLWTFIWELSRFFSHSIFIFLIFGIFLFVLGLPVPDKDSVTYLWPIFGLLGCIIGLVRAFRDDGSFFTGRNGTTTQVLEG